MAAIRISANLCLCFRSVSIHTTFWVSLINSLSTVSCKEILAPASDKLIKTLGKIKSSPIRPASSTVHHSLLTAPAILAAYGAVVSRDWGRSLFKSRLWIECPIRKEEWTFSCYASSPVYIYPPIFSMVACAHDTPSCLIMQPLSIHP